MEKLPNDTNHELIADIDNEDGLAFEILFQR
jgi:hypothetical protein